MKSLTSLDVAWDYASAHIASFASRYPRTLTATVSLGLAGFAATAFGIAPDVPDASDLPQRTVVESIATVARQNLVAAGQTAGAAKHLAAESETLKSRIEAFRV